MELKFWTNLTVNYGENDFGSFLTFWAETLAVENDIRLFVSFFELINLTQLLANYSRNCLNSCKYEYLHLQTIT